MAPHLVHLQGFLIVLVWGLAHPVLRSYSLVTAPKYPAFLQKIGGLARREPTLDGRRVVVQLAGAPPQGEEEEEGQEGLVELQLFVCLATGLGPGRGDGAPGTGLMEPARAGAEAPRRGKGPGLSGEEGLGLREGLEWPTGEGEKGTRPGRPTWGR